MAFSFFFLISTLHTKGRRGSEASVHNVFYVVESSKTIALEGIMYDTWHRVNALFTLCGNNIHDINIHDIC